MSEFLTASKTIVTGFLQNVIIIDDEAFFDESPLSLLEKEEFLETAATLEIGGRGSQISEKQKILNELLKLKNRAHFNIALAKEYLVNIDNQKFENIQKANEILSALFEILHPTLVLNLEEPPELNELKTLLEKLKANDAVASSLIEEIKALIGEDEQAHTVNVKKLSDSFAKKGLMCSVIRPSQTDEHFVSNSITALKKADIVILDWNINIDGKGSDETVKELIKSIVQEDEEHKQKSMRYIAIYSGEDTLKSKLEIIRDLLNPLLKMEGSFKGDYQLYYDHLQINIYAKKSQRTQIEPDIVVDEDELVAKIIDDFTQLVHGIVPNIALRSLAEIRKNTHRLLSKFSDNLDDAYLTHRAMLPEPKDAEELLISMVTDELQSILDDCKLDFDVDSFNFWFNERMNTLDQQDFDTRYKCCYFNKKNYKSQEEFQSLTSFCVNGTHDYQEIFNGEEVKFDDVKLNPLITQNREILNDVLKDDVQNYILYGQSNANRERLLFKALKGNPGVFTSILNDNGKISNDELALLSTNKTFYNSPVPYLTLGTILKCGTGKYFISLMPRCDAARVSTTGNTFPILPLSKDNKNFEVIFKDTTVRRYKIDFAPKKLKTILFKQDPGAVNSPIYARKEEDGTYTFRDSSDVKYTWIAELKKEKAQNISNKFAAQLSRVGFNESEYLRQAYQ